MKCIHFGFACLFMVLGGCCATYYITLDEDVVTIYLKSPTANTILFASSLDGYERHELKQRNGLWGVTLPTDKSFRYFYMTDGKIYLPPCPLKENDDFGSQNCIFEPKL